MTTSITIPQEAKKLIKSAAKQLNGMKKRVFMAEVSKTLCYERPRLTETEFGWSRDTVKLGLNELRTGLEWYVLKKRYIRKNFNLSSNLQSHDYPSCQRPVTKPA